MNWIIFLIIAFIISVLILGACGIGGGMMMLVIMNGMSESDANPVLIVFALLVIGFSILISTLTIWLFVKARKVENIRFWQMTGVSTAANIALILLMALVVFVMRIIN